jgi:hypothetical protein
MSAGRQLLYCCFYQVEKRDIFCGGAGQAGKSVPRDVMRGLDPGIHLLCKIILAEDDGLPGQARQ